MILDAEIVAFDAEGRPSFNAMQNRSAQTERAVLYCFDLLHFAGVNLRQAPYAIGAAISRSVCCRRRWCNWCTSLDDGVALQAAAAASGFEGVVGKRKNSRYEAGKRSASWVKVKSITSADFVIGGYTQGKGARSPLGALLVGYWDGGKLIYVSHVGSGFNDDSLSDVRKRLEPLQRKTNPFSTKPELNAPAKWVDPELVAEVKFQDWTEDGHLRAPVFLRLRDDIDPKTVRREIATKSARRRRRRKRGARATKGKFDFARRERRRSACEEEREQRDRRCVAPARQRQGHIHDCCRCAHAEADPPRSRVLAG